MLVEQKEGIVVVARVVMRVVTWVVWRERIWDHKWDINLSTGALVLK
jgi:hypothetical protein